jgi:hypothetical protein
MTVTPPGFDRSRTRPNPLSRKSIAASTNSCGAMTPASGTLSGDLPVPAGARSLQSNTSICLSRISARIRRFADGQTPPPVVFMIASKVRGSPRWALGAVASASRLHRVGRGFESLSAHHFSDEGTRQFHRHLVRSEPNFLNIFLSLSSCLQKRPKRPTTAHRSRVSDHESRISDLESATHPISTMKFFIARASNKNNNIQRHA